VSAVAGIDGCRAGWVVAWLADAEGPATVEVVPTLARVVAALADAAITLAGIDMPIGLPASGRRACDVAARARLGPRASSVFPAPVRAALEATSYPEALRRSRAVDGRGLPKQSWFLIPKIVEVDAAVRAAGVQRLLEVHPELAFAALAGRPLDAAKRTPQGRAERVGLLRTWLTGAEAQVAAPPRGAQADDVADALAVALSARRIAAGLGERVGGDPDPTGLPMAIQW
jgi:predicted RNase H-like nuclease